MEIWGTKLWKVEIGVGVLFTRHNYIGFQHVRTLLISVSAATNRAILGFSWNAAAPTFGAHQYQGIKYELPELKYGEDRRARPTDR